MLDYAMRLGGALLFRASRRTAWNRRWLAGGTTGLRILTFHEVGGRQFSPFRRLIDWCRDRFEVGVPEDCDALLEGRMVPGARDKFLATFDDGLRSHYTAAEWLADQGIRASFFIVPSWLDRSVGEYLSHHRHHGVTAFEFDSSARSLASTQVREIAAMGHRICAHNDAHRSLADLRTRADLDYEISQAVEAVERLTGRALPRLRVCVRAAGQPVRRGNRVPPPKMQTCLLLRPGSERSGADASFSASRPHRLRVSRHLHPALCRGGSGPLDDAATYLVGRSDRPPSPKSQRCHRRGPSHDAKPRVGAIPRDRVCREPVAKRANLDQRPIRRPIRGRPGRLNWEDMIRWLCMASASFLI